MIPIINSHSSPQINSRQNVCIQTARAVVTLSFLIGGCSGVSPASHMPTLLEQEANPNVVIQEKLSGGARSKLPVGLVLVPYIEQSKPQATLSEDSLARFSARTKNELESQVPLDIQKVVRLEELQPGKIEEQLKRFGKHQQLEFVLLVLTSSEEVQTPTYLDASSPDVGILLVTRLKIMPWLKWRWWIFNRENPSFRLMADPMRCWNNLMSLWHRIAIPW